MSRQEFDVPLGLHSNPGNIKGLGLSQTPVFPPGRTSAARRPEIAGDARKDACQRHLAASPPIVLEWMKCFVAHLTLL